MRFVGTALVAGTIGVFFLLADGGWIRAGTEGSTKPDFAAKRTGDKLARPHRFTKFVGMTVQNVDGEKIGVVEDLILQQQSGQVRYVIVKSGGFIGHRRMVVVPAAAIAMTTAKVRIASVDITKRQWKKAPEFKQEDLPLLAEPGRSQSITRFYDRSEEKVRAVPKSDMRLGSLTSTGHEAGHGASSNENAQLELASDIVGKDVVNRKQQEIGEVTDLVLDFSGKKPALALLSVAQLLGTTDTFLVPVRLLSPSEAHKVQVDADRGSFERAEPFSREAWQVSEKAKTNNIYRWEGR